MLASTPWALCSACISAGDIIPSIPGISPIPGIVEPLGMGIGMVAVVVGDAVAVSEPCMPP